MFHLLVNVRGATKSHLTLCPQCREHIDKLESVGGTLLDAAKPEPMSADALDSLFARIDAPHDTIAEPPKPTGWVLPNGLPLHYRAA